MLEQSLNKTCTVFTVRYFTPSLVACTCNKKKKNFVQTFTFLGRSQCDKRHLWPLLVYASPRFTSHQQPPKPSAELELNAWEMTDCSVEPLISAFFLYYLNVFSNLRINCKPGLPGNKKAPIQTHLVFFSKKTHKAFKSDVSRRRDVPHTESEVRRQAYCSVALRFRPGETERA